MRCRWLPWWSMLLALPAAAEPVAPQMFAYGRGLSFESGAPLVQLTLPPEVYRAVARPDLGDIRVFNGAGDVVPHVLHLPPISSAARVGHVPPVFPVYANKGQDADTVVMQVQRDATGRIERVETRRATDMARHIVVYLVDASALTEEPVGALELDWGAEDGDFLGVVTLQASDDLAHWSTLADNVGVASMHLGSERLERRRIEFPPRRAKYYRITWPAAQPLPSLPIVKLEEVAPAPAYARAWESIALAPGAEPGVYMFTQPGQFPVDRARVRLSPQTNRVVHAVLESRESADAWVRRGAGPVYRLKFGSLTLDAGEIDLARGAAREWRLTLTPPEGLENVSPEIELGWVPHRLVFVPAGEGPFRLAYGAPQVTHADAPPHELLENIEAENSSGRIVTASVGPQFALGAAEPPRKPWRTWLSWLGLALVAALLAWTAWRLRRTRGGAS